MIPSARIIGCGGYVPDKILTNEELAENYGLETTSEWIVSRTGILQRHIAAPDQLTSDLAQLASLQALAHAGINVTALDGIIVATTTPDDTFPGTAVTLQHKLGAYQAFAFDVQAVCSGFLYALCLANGLIRSGQAKTLLIVGAEVLSRILDWSDRKTCILFGDGAGAVVLKADEMSSGGILSTHLYADGGQRDLLYVDGGPAQGQRTGFIRMQGREVFKHAVDKISQSIKDALLANSFTLEDIDWFIPHQANLRIIEAIMQRHQWETNKVVITVNDHANTSAASIPLALAQAAHQNLFIRQQNILLAAFGAGLTWGSAIIQW